MDNGKCREIGVCVHTGNAARAETMAGKALDQHRSALQLPSGSGLAIQCHALPFFSEERRHCRLLGETVILGRTLVVMGNLTSGEQND